MSARANRLKDEKLKMPHGTANNRLRKALLYKYVQLAGDDICYRCGEKISEIDNFSVEHKRAWMQQQNPVEAFFDLTNIAFSHAACNSAAAARNKTYGSDAERKAAEMSRWYQKNHDEIRKRRKEMRDLGKWS